MTESRFRPILFLSGEALPAWPAEGATRAPMVAANTQTPEFKSFLVNIERL